MGKRQLVHRQRLGLGGRLQQVHGRQFVRRVRIADQVLDRHAVVLDLELAIPGPGDQDAFLLVVIRTDHRRLGGGLSPFHPRQEGIGGDHGVQFFALAGAIGDDGARTAGIHFQDPLHGAVRPFVGAELEGLPVQGTTQIELLRGRDVGNCRIDGLTAFLLSHGLVQTPGKRESKKRRRRGALAAS
jgi:hypothetical protein